MNRRPRSVVVIVAASVLAAGSAIAAPGASVASQQVPTLFPGDEWDTTTPEEIGLDPDVLGAVAFEAGAADSNCLVVVRHGRLAAEWYWNDTTSESSQEIFSATKSVTSAVVGIAQDNGDLDVAQPASDFIPEWQGTESADVTIENLLSNDSGREWDPGIDYGDMATEAPDKSAFSVALGQAAEPGTVWVYNNSAIQTLSEVVEAATGTEPADLAAAELFAPIGMDDTRMTLDSAGNTLTFMGAQSTCRDLARFGLLYLNGGTWDGDEVISSEWVDASVGQPSQELNASYGYLWWLNRPGPIQVDVVAPIVAGSDDNTVEGPRVPGAPADMYWASGLFGQWVQVDPGSETVVVRLGAFGSDFSNATLARIVTEGVVD